MALIFSIWPALAAKSERWLSMRLEVQLPEPSLIAVNFRWLAPSTDTLAVLVVLVSISPVPDGVPVSMIQFEDKGALLAAPVKSSVHTVDQVTPDVAVAVGVDVLVGEAIGVLVGGPGGVVVAVAPPDPAKT